MPWQKPRDGGDSPSKPMHNVWLLMQERVGSTWLASTHLQQHPEVHMLKGGQGEACFGMPFKTRREQAEEACFAQLLAHRSACKALGARVCGWKAKADFCPTSRCESWLWVHMRPIVLQHPHNQARGLFVDVQGEQPRVPRSSTA